MLLDTSGLLAYHSDKETDHRKARDLMRKNEPYLIHSFVLAEFIALAYARKLSGASGKCGIL